MKYEEFKVLVKKHIKEYLPKEYENWSVVINEIPKVNGYLDGLHLLPASENGETPTIYLQDLYTYYQECRSMELVYIKAASVFVAGMEYASHVRKKTDLQDAENHVIYCLINAEENQRLLQDVPHRLTMDLALIYRVMYADEAGGFNSAIINNALAEELELDEEALFALAEKNTPRILPQDLSMCDGVLSILTNQYHVLGAAVMLYADVLDRIAERLQSDLYILPSSIHEVFVYPAKGQNVEAMNLTVEQANHSMVRPEEILSDHVYFYDWKEGRVSVPA